MKRQMPSPSVGRCTCTLLLLHHIPSLRPLLLPVLQPLLLVARMLRLKG